MAEKAQVVLYHHRNSKPKAFRIKRFCIDNEKERLEYEDLCLKESRGEIKFLKEPVEIFSQKSDLLYMLVHWAEF